jgi:hypothetical protein
MTTRDYEQRTLSESVTRLLKSSLTAATAGIDFPVVLI